MIAARDEAGRQPGLDTKTPANAQVLGGLCCQSTAFAGHPQVPGVANASQRCALLCLAPGRNEMANVYRRRRGFHDTWHFCRNCSNWPTVGYEERYTPP